MSEIRISPTSLRRFPKYRDVARVLAKLGWDYITSADLARACEMQEVLVRKDLAQTGVVGRPHHGYLIRDLISSVVKVLGWDSPQKAVLVGAGWLAETISSFPIFADCNLSFSFAIDTDPEKIGKTLNGLPVLSYEAAAERIKAESIRFAALLVPMEVAQNSADWLMSNGIEAILNFTSAAVTAVNSDRVAVADAHLSPQIAELSYWLKTHAPLPKE